MKSKQFSIHLLQMEKLKREIGFTKTVRLFNGLICNFICIRRKSRLNCPLDKSFHLYFVQDRKVFWYSALYSKPI